MRLIFKYLFTILVTVLSVSASFGQYTIEANILLSPPYPTNFDAYVDYLEEGIIQINNLADVEQEVFFDLDFSEKSGLLRVSTDGMLTEAITLQPGVNILSPMDIQNAFSSLTEENFVTAGLSQSQLNNIQLNRQLPEGSYQLCLTAYNENNQQISDPALSCTDFDIVFAERPIIQSPFENDEVDTSGFLFVTWSHDINNAMIQNRLEYTLKIIDITEQAVQNVELSMLDPGLSPDYEENLGSVSTANLLDDVELPLTVGHQYAMRVTAADPDEELGFQFDGHSEIVVFWYGPEGQVGGGGDLPAPEITSPTDGDPIDISEMEDLVISGTFTHDISNSAANNMKYKLRVIDLTENEKEEVEQSDFIDGSLTLIYDDNVEKGAFIIESTESDSLLKGHEYALLLTASSDDGSITLADGGNSEVITFSLGEEEEDESEEKLAAPVLVSPESGYLADGADTLSINLSWTHEVDDTLAKMLSYEFKVIDLDTQKVTTINYADFEDDNYDYLWNDALVSKDTILKSEINTTLVKDHKYAIIIKVSSEDERITFENDGYTELVTFIFGEEEEEADNEEGCGGKCLAELPTDQEEAPIKKGDNLFMGNLSLTVDEVLTDSEGGFKGKGFVSVNFFKQIKINVTFEGLKANAKKFVFDGEANAVFDESTVKADGLVAFGGSSALKVDFEKAKLLSNALRTSGKLVSALAGKQTSLPLGFDRDVDGDKMIVGITEMNFTPTKATLTALFSLDNPDWGEYVPTLGASDICFTNNGFGEVVKLFLGEDYNIPLSNEQLTLIASENNTADEKGTYCLIDCKGFKEGQITGQIGVPREVLLPEAEDGSIKPEGFAKLTLSGTFYKSNGFMLSASMSPSQIPGLEGFSFTMKNGYYDASDQVNPTGLTFPQGYTRQETDKTWKGIWFGDVSLKAPKDWGFANEDDRTTVGINDLIKDDTGLSVVASAKNILGIEKGEIEGFAISIEELKLDIIRGEFKEVKMTGKIGLPILPKDKYLDYEGIVDRNKKEEGKESAKNTAQNQGNNAVAGEALAMSFIVKPDEEGYDIDWIKSHIDFEESSQFILENNNKRRGFSATLTGKISIKGNGLDASNSSRPAGAPDIEIPGLKFEGMEISRMIDKSGKEGTNTGKNSSGGFVFKRPTMSFHGTSFNNLTGGTAAENLENPEAEEKEEDEAKEPKMNGFSLTLSDVAFQFGEGDESEKKEITNGSPLQLMVKPNISLVGRQGKKNKAGKDKGFAITAEGKFTIDALVQKEGNKMTFGYKSLTMDSLGVESEIGPIEINGSLGFYNEDPKFGDGMVGNLDVKVPLVDVKLEGRFGKMNAGKEDAYSYWYLFGDVSKDMKKKVPIVKAGAYFSLWGFNGGAYYHMRDANPSALTAAERYLPDDKISLGLKAGITFSVTEPNVLWAKTTFGIQFKDDYTLDKISLDGDAYMLQLEPKEMPGEEIDGIKAALRAAINFKKVGEEKEIEFDANLDIYANIADGLLVGNMNQSIPNLVVKSTAHVDSEKWSFLMGTPSEPGSVQVGIPDLATVNAKAYLMAGKGVDFEKATLHPFIKGLLYGSSQDLKGAKASGDEVTRTNTNGFAMGMNIDYKLDIKASILYAQFRAMFGFDLSLIEYPGITCANTGGDEIGMGGYYATGQVFAGFRGDVGLDVDLWFYTGKVSLAEVYAAMMIKGGLPNPIWASGRARMGYSVLGGLLKGSTSFDVEIGEKCVQEQANPFVGQNFIADIDPGQGAKNVNVYVNPRISYENRLGKYEILSPPNDGGTRKMRTFDVRLENTSLTKVGGASISMSKETKWDNLSTLLRTSKMLDDYTSYNLKVSVGVYELKNGSYVKLMDKDGKHVMEKKEIQFTTGAKPDYLSIDNIKLMYPHNGEKYYLRYENFYQECYLQLDKAQPELWAPTTPAGKEWHTKVEAHVILLDYHNRAIETIHKAPLSLANYGRVVYFKLPNNKLKNSRKYRIAIQRVHYRNPNYNTSGNELANLNTNTSNSNYEYVRKGKTYANYESKSPPDKTVFSYNFQTSKYNTFHEKVKGKTYKYETRNPTPVFHGNGVQYIIQNKEPFSSEELMSRYLTFNQTAYGGVVRVEEQYDDSSNHPYHNLLYLLKKSDLLSFYWRLNSSEKNFRFEWEKRWKFRNNNVYDGLEYNDQMTDIMKMTYDRGDARFWFNTLDLIDEEDVRALGIYLQTAVIHKWNFDFNWAYTMAYGNNAYDTWEANKYLLRKPSNAKKYKVKLTYTPPYLSRKSGTIKTRIASTVYKQF